MLAPSDWKKILIDSSRIAVLGTRNFDFLHEANEGLHVKFIDLIKAKSTAPIIHMIAMSPA